MLFRSVSQSRYQGYPNNDGKLQGFNSLAEGDRLGYSGVSGNEEFSGGGEICSDLSDPTSGNIDSSEYRGGVGTRFNQRIHLSSTGSQGIVDGTGNSSDCGATSELSGSGQFEGIASEDRDDRQNVERFNQEVTEQALGEFGIWNLELGMGNLELGMGNLELGMGNLKELQVRIETIGRMLNGLIKKLQSKL